MTTQSFYSQQTSDRNALIARCLEAKMPPRKIGGLLVERGMGVSGSYLRELIKDLRGVAPGLRELQRWQRDAEKRVQKKRRAHIAMRRRYESHPYLQGIARKWRATD